MEMAIPMAIPTNISVNTGTSQDRHDELVKNCDFLPCWETIIDKAD